MLIEQYNELSFELSKKITKKYSTSFYTASLLFPPEERSAIFGIYGFVRLADEIVDTFMDFKQAELLDKFESDFYDAIQDGISMNPILNSFMLTVKKYEIPDEYIKAFLSSMRADLTKNVYENKDDSDKYIYGSAEVVGLMCLKVFCGKDDDMFESLKSPARHLGAAFQKVNFLRDLREDLVDLGRVYFPGVNIECFDEETKDRLIGDIENDFKIAFDGIRQLPSNARVAVWVAYDYFRILLSKIKHTPADELIARRLRISNIHKLTLITGRVIKCRLNTYL